MKKPKLRLNIWRKTKQLKDSMTNLKINPDIYHGGDLEIKLLDCERDKSFIILKCVEDK